MAPLARAAALLAALMAAAPAARAQTAALCTACIEQARCPAADASCTPACEARYFTIDPRRAQCLAQCAAARTQCQQEARAACRQQKACR
jgi:hypothetical protein